MFVFRKGKGCSDQGRIWPRVETARTVLAEREAAREEAWECTEYLVFPMTLSMVAKHERAIDAWYRSLSEASIATLCRAFRDIRGQCISRGTP